MAVACPHANNLSSQPFTVKSTTISLRPLCTKRHSATISSPKAADRKRFMFHCTPTASICAFTTKAKATSATAKTRAPWAISCKLRQSSPTVAETRANPSVISSNSMPKRRMILSLSRIRSMRSKDPSCKNPPPLVIQEMRGLLHLYGEGEALQAPLVLGQKLRLVPPANEQVGQLKAVTVLSLQVLQLLAFLHRYLDNRPRHGLGQDTYLLLRGHGHHTPGPEGAEHEVRRQREITLTLQRPWAATKCHVQHDLVVRYSVHLLKDVCMSLADPWVNL